MRRIKIWFEVFLKKIFICYSGISWAILPLEFTYPIPILGILYRPWRLLVVAIAVPFAVATVLLYFAPESPKFLSVKGDHDAALEVIKKIYAGNMKMPRNTFEVSYFIFSNLYSPL